MRGIGIGLGIGRNRGSVSAAAFSLSFTGLTGGVAIVGTHASIGYTIDPDNGTETVKWSNSSNPADAATYGTGASPTDFAAGDEGRLYLHVTDGADTRTISAPILYAAAVNTVAPVVSGSLSLGDTLSVANGTWTAAGGAYTYQWQRGGVNIAGATSSTYDIVVADDAASIRCVVTYTNSGGAVSANSNAVTVEDFTIPVITGVPTISGTTAQGSTLTASAASVAGNPTPSRTWQWERSGTPISGATSSTYELVADDVGETITVVQTETNALGADSAESAATATIGATVNPSLTLNSQTAGSGGNPDSISVTFTYAGSDTLDLYAATTPTSTPPSEAQVIAGTGGGITEGVSQLGYTGGTIDLSGFTDDTVGYLHVVVIERSNGGTSGVETIALTDIDFTPLGVTSAATDAIDGTQIIITMNDTVIGSEVTGNWTVPGHTVSNVNITTPTVTLTITPAIANGDVDTVSYSGGNLTDERGNALAAFSGQAVTNNVPAPSTGITVVETHTASQQSHTTPLDITLGSLAENDRVLVIRASDTTGSLNAISGYTSIYNATRGGVGLAVEEKKMGATPDTVTTIPVNRGEPSVNEEAVIVYVLRGVDTTTFLDVAFASSAGGTSSSYSPPAVTTVTDGALVIAGVIKDDVNNATDGTLPTGYSEKTFATANTGFNTNANIVAGVKLIATAGLETPGAFTIDGTDDQMQGFTIAVRPA